MMEAPERKDPNNLESSISRKNDSESTKLSIGERIGKWDVTRNNLNWIFGLSAFAMIVLYIMTLFNNGSNWIGNLIGVVGGLASVFGIYLTLCQIIETKKNITLVGAIAKATETTAKETKQSVRKALSISQVAKYCEQIKRIQESLMNSELKIVIHLTQELQDAVIELKDHLKSLDIDFDEDGMTNHIKKMGMNVGFLRTSYTRNSEGDKRDGIHKDFDNLLKTMFELKAQLTTHDNERSQGTI